MHKIILCTGDKVKIAKIYTPDEDDEGNLTEEISFKYTVIRANGDEETCDLDEDVEIVS